MNFLILALATYRLAHLLADEPGPFDVFGRLRDRVGIGYDDLGTPYGSNELARGMLCVKCNSVWLGLGWAVAYWLWPDVTWLALPLALSAGAMFLNNLISLWEERL